MSSYRRLADSQAGTSTSEAETSAPETGAERGQTASYPSRATIENVRPEIDGGRFPIKRTLNQTVEVEADILADGHDLVRAVVRYRPAGDADWQEVPLEPRVNDRWSARFMVTRVGRYHYTVHAWIDRFGSWRQELAKKFDAGADISSELLEGAAWVAQAAETAARADAALLAEHAEILRGGGEQASRVRAALGADLLAAMQRNDRRPGTASLPRELEVVVDPDRARFRSWYEMFPRSCSPESASPGSGSPESRSAGTARHGTFRDCEKRLKYIATMGFDVLYLPPIHPIGHTNRKGRNNSMATSAGDPGSCWAIGAEQGGHDAIHPQLGTLEDFRRLVARAAEFGIEIALDLAYQCSPDHPYVREHPEWFRHRSDGTIKYAENPPKKYQDIFPINFETAAWRELWEELKRVALFWIGEGIRIFRVDNPHTKPFAFWEWLINEIKREQPDVIFLSEAFTRPKIMYRLAKLGFSQSYTYFAWRNSKRELTQYFTELTQGDVREYFRPHLWPNTPDILTEYLQMGGRPAFMARLVLAATLASNYGIYGPAFELCENRALKPGSEEYLNSEKYEVRHWNLDQPHSLRDLITRVNWIRRETPALQNDASLRFHPVDNDRLIAYSKSSEDGRDLVLVVVNLDPHHTQSGWLELPGDVMGLEEEKPFQAHDLLSDTRYLWQGTRNYIELNPRELPASIFRLQRRLRSERDFDYFM